MNTTQTPVTITTNPAGQDILITREFNAPRELVFKAHTDAALYAQWIAPQKYTVRFEAFDPENGGSWRYKFKDMNANELSFRGVYHLVKAPERIINTFEFEGKGGYIILSLTTFETVNENKTKLTVQSIFTSTEKRNAELTFLTEESLNDSFSRLDEILSRR